jgi:2-beta-glucuronyltransferase
MSVAPSARRVLIVTGQHFADAPRKVDLHFMTESLIAKGDAVDFLVWRLSPISRLLRDGRHAFAKTHRLNRWERLSPHLEQYIWYGLVHPLNLKLALLNRLADPLFVRFGAFLPKQVKNRLSGYSHILIESGPSPLLMRALRAGAPQAKIIYHAADRLRTIGVPPVVERVMAETADLYDQIHVMAEALTADFSARDKLLYLPHGIDKQAFDAVHDTPYRGSKNAVSVGDMLFDAEAISVMAAANPDWTFHLFGKKARLSHHCDNVIAHGEQPFEAIVPFIRFADLGIAPYRSGANADYLSQSSLKMIQYSYCRLPIVAPAFASAGRAHVVGYDPADPASIRAAFARASSLDRTTIQTKDILSWDEAVDVVFG